MADQGGECGFTNCRLVIFEGYDGAGKSSLIRTVCDSLTVQPIRIVGRKTEPNLIPISSAIENESGQLRPDAEILLRFALETARQEIVRQAASSGSLIMLDRATPSLLAWIDYYGLQWSQYEALARMQLDFYRNALLVICLADFETCWSRIESKEIHSKKERLGREINRRYYDLYMANLNRYAVEFQQVVSVDCVGQSLSDSAAQIKREVEFRCLS